MSEKTRWSAMLLGTVLAPVLCGCIATPIDVALETREAVAPAFATEEEALAVATVAYGDYLNILTTIASEDGAGMERLDSYAAPELSAFEKAGLTQLQEKRLRPVGQQQIANAVLQSYIPAAESGVNIVSIYVCVDVSGLDLVDHGGHSVVETSRPTQTPFEATFNLPEDGSSVLVVATNNVWGGEGVC